MEPSFSKYIWTHTRKAQIWILIVVAVSMLPYYLAFDLPKQIVNGPIMGAGFELPATSLMAPFLADIRKTPRFARSRCGVVITRQG